MNVMIDTTAVATAEPDAYPELAATESMIFVVDEDSDVRRAISDLLCEAGHFVETFQSGPDFLCHARPDMNSCLLVEAGPQGSHGLDVLRQLTGSHTQPAVVLMTERGDDIAMAVSAMKAGAVDVLTKPVLRQDLLEAVTIGLEEHRLRRESRFSALLTLQRAATLTPRERQVMALVTAGLMNKQVANELNLSEISIKIHRGNLMKKMGVRTLPDLVRAADLLSRYV